MLRESAGWLICSAADARTKLRCSASATTWRNCWSSMATNAQALGAPTLHCAGSSVRSAELGMTFTHAIACGED